MPAHHSNTTAPAAKPKLRRNGPLHIRVAGKRGLVRVVAAGDVAQLPAAYAADGRLYLCPVDSVAAGSCPLGAKCADVHLTAASHAAPKFYNAHERQDEWTSIADVPATREYAFFEAALGEISVAPPNAKTAVDASAVCAAMCLKTAALDAARSPLSHCAHFRAKGVCDLGARCMFIHALEHLEPAAAPATPPHAMPTFADETLADAHADDSGSTSPFGSLTAMPPRRHTPTTPKKESSVTKAATSHTVTPPRPAATRRHNPYTSSATSSCHVFAASGYDEAAFGPSLAVSTSGTPDESPAFAAWRGPRNGGAVAILASHAPSSPSSVAAMTMTKRRYRHDPYSANGCSIWSCPPQQHF